MNREVVHYSPARAPVLRHEALVRRTRTEVEKAYANGVASGEFGASSKIVRLTKGPSAGYYAVKVERLREPAPPPPRWLRPVQWVGGILAGLGIVCTGLAMAVGAALDAAGRAVAAVPWATVTGGGVVLLVVAFMLRRAIGGGCKFLFMHWH